MKWLKCDDNFVGFLTAIYQYYCTVKDADGITSSPESVNLIDEEVEISSDVELARKVRSGIIKKAGQNGYREISEAYLSSDPNKEKKIFNFLKIVFEHGTKVYTMFHNPDVIAFNDILHKVQCEVHRMHGFLRFQEMENGIFYSYFGSDNDILELLVPHFKARFNTQQFVLHDVKRKKMIFYDGKECHKLLTPEPINIALSEKELIVSDLWKQYNLNVAIADRKNIRLQNHFAPKKYRWFMNEF